MNEVLREKLEVLAAYETPHLPQEMLWSTDEQRGSFYREAILQWLRDRKTPVKFTADGIILWPLSP